MVLVEDSKGLDQWGVLSDSASAIPSGVIYGHLPPGATKELQPAALLVSGGLYRASVYRFTGPGHEDGVLSGSVTFRVRP